MYRAQQIGPGHCSSHIGYDLQRDWPSDSFVRRRISRTAGFGLGVVGMLNELIVGSIRTWRSETVLGDLVVARFERSKVEGFLVVCGNVKGSDLV